jgi:crotonobetainyl-CoA:carnitine CoA-transferase CaiB-like acyl-CoA transferase
MLEATLASMGWAVSNWLIAAIRPEPLGNENMTASPSGTFKTGAGLLNIAANKQDQFERLCELIGRKELASDPRYVNREDRKQRRSELKAELESALAAKPASEWSQLFNRHGVPAGEILTIPEVLEHPQIFNRNLIKRFPKAPGTDRDVAVVRSGFRLASGDPEPVVAPPVLSADTEDILAELGYDQDVIIKLRNDGAV